MTRNRGVVLMLAGLLLAAVNSPDSVYGVVQNFYITAGGAGGPVPDGDGLVQRLDGDGSNLTTLVNLGSTSRPRGIVVDPLNSKLYWNDWGTGLTQRSDLDGRPSDVRYESSSVLWPGGI